MKIFKYPTTSKWKTALFILISAVVLTFLVQEYMSVDQLIQGKDSKYSNYPLSSSDKWLDLDKSYKRTLMIFIPISLFCLLFSIFHFMKNWAVLEFSGDSLKIKRLTGGETTIPLHNGIQINENQSLAYVTIFSDKKPKDRITFYYNLNNFVELKNILSPYQAKL